MSSFYNLYGACVSESKNAVLVGDNMRVTPITSELIRFEFSKNGTFCDYPTQTVINRDFSDSFCTCTCDKHIIIVETAAIKLTIKNNKPDSVFFKEHGNSVNIYDKYNLSGTARTLDMSFGRVKLESGIVSRNGVALLDDSKSCLIMPDDNIKSRYKVFNCAESDLDIYVFAYGKDYPGAVKDYYRLTGFTPLLPRFVFGNWWSRYYAYSQNEYLTLMKTFKKENIPFSVSVIDMDWHETDVYPKYGKEALDYYKPSNPVQYLTGCFSMPGWTGYTWNKDLFPDHTGFLSDLHSMGKAVSLNLHPAQGIRYYENGYEEFCNYLGLDSSLKKCITLNLNDKKFRDGYFKFIHNPMEQEGVDFWWIDWQQGIKSCVDDIDPLWLLNHYHSLNFAENGKRPLILSRYAGPGSHRYPVGFSGDTVINRATLSFQSYFTSTASNIGYSWWSHDIGGHHFGVRDGELYTRWVQLGVFSPVFRLHSSKNDFLGKEPWKFDKTTEIITSDFLRLRNRLIPYLYSMNYRTAVLGEPLIKPMYYSDPDCDAAYEVKNEFWFGTELLVSSVYKKCSRKTGLSETKVFLPDGEFTDVFTGWKYTGGKSINMYRSIWTIPVLAKAGAVIPMSTVENMDWSVPESLDIVMYYGNGGFSLYEDDGISLNYKIGDFSLTEMNLSVYGNRVEFEIFSPKGNIEIVPEKRSFNLCFKDIRSCSSAVLFIDGNELTLSSDNDSYLLFNNVITGNNKGFKLTLNDIRLSENEDKNILINNFLSSVRGRNSFKSVKYNNIHRIRCLNRNITGPIDEILNLK